MHDPSSLTGLIRRYDENEWRTIHKVNGVWEDAYFEATDKLLHGRLREGFAEIECRWQTAHQKPYAKNYTEPQWSGQSLDRKTLFLWHEQGLGDMIMVHRYIPMLERMAGQVKVAVQTPLRELFRNNLHSEVQDKDGEVTCDYQLPMMSLPYVFKTDLINIPPPAPIQPSKPLLMEMPGFNVGIQWAGNINHPDDAARSIPFAEFARILKVKGVNFWGLQRNIRKEELADIKRSGLTCLWFDGFEALAAIVAKMDLVITIDSALTHLSGAMGKPTWDLIQQNPDWRWMLHRGDSPWYPSVRLFRQRRVLQWRPVIDHIIEVLRRRRDHAVAQNH